MRTAETPLSKLALQWTGNAELPPEAIAQQIGEETKRNSIYFAFFEVWQYIEYLHTHVNTMRDFFMLKNYALATIRQYLLELNIAPIPIESSAAHQHSEVENFFSHFPNAPITVQQGAIAIHKDWMKQTPEGVMKFEISIGHIFDANSVLISYRMGTSSKFQGNFFSTS